MDPQSEDSPQDDSQPTALELPEVPVSVLHRSGSGAPPVGISRPRHVVHAGSCQSRTRWRPLPHLRQGKLSESIHSIKFGFQFRSMSVVCLQVHQWKLLSHVVKDHGLSLKPAHLSYKCTVCTATFTMYKLFENHVYTAHSVVAKKVLDKDNKKTASSGSATPLRINDEITIIPQSAGRNNSDSSADLSVSRTCKGDSQSKRSRVDVIDLSDDEDARGDAINLPKSQVTITKVPAPVGYKNSREPLSKRSRTEDNDTE